MIGGAGDDVYYVDNGSDQVIENPGEGNDAVFYTVHYVLPTNVEALVMQGSADLQGQRLHSGDSLFEHIARLASGGWNRNGQLGLVVGATFPAEIERVRELAPTLPLLIPGIGAQGGDAAATVRAGWRHDGTRTVAPIIVSSSRAVLYASAGADFAAAARAAALASRDELNAARPVALNQPQ